MTNKEKSDLIDILKMCDFEQVDDTLWLSEIGDNCMTVAVEPEYDFVTVDFNGKETLYLPVETVIDVLAEDCFGA